MAKRKDAVSLVKRYMELDEEKKKLFEERDAIVQELAKMSDKEVRKTGYRIRKAFEDSPIEYGHGPVPEVRLVPLTKKEREAEQ